MNIRDTNKKLRILILIGLVVLMNIIVLSIYKIAPTKSLEWLSKNSIWNYLIIGCANFSIIFGEISILFPELKDKRKLK